MLASQRENEMNAIAETVGPAKLKGEGDQETIIRTRVRIDCEKCGDEPANRRHTYLLPNARRDPDSSAFGRDDCSWCSDHEVFTCAACYPEGRHPSPVGYVWCATFPAIDRFAHMFLRYHETRAVNP